MPKLATKLADGYDNRTKIRANQLSLERSSGRGALGGFGRKLGMVSRVRRRAFPSFKLSARTLSSLVLYDGDQ